MLRLTIDAKNAKASANIRARTTNMG